MTNGVIYYISQFSLCVCVCTASSCMPIFGQASLNIYRFYLGRYSVAAGQ